jgi:hypothetical protein
VPCPECGAAGAATTEACEARFQALGRERFDDSELASDWRLIVDCYSVQHDTYILSGRSLAAHLLGVGIAVEHGGDASLLRAAEEWLSRTRELAKPPVPARRGGITVNEVINAAPEERHAVVSAWAATAWDAWSGQQPLARRWIAELRSRPARQT